MKIAKVTPKGTYIIDLETRITTIVNTKIYPKGHEMSLVWFEEVAEVDEKIYETLLHNSKLEG